MSHLPYLSDSASDRKKEAKKVSSGFQILKHGVPLNLCNIFPRISIIIIIATLLLFQTVIENLWIREAIKPARSPVREQKSLFLAPTAAISVVRHHRSLVPLQQSASPSPLPAARHNHESPRRFLAPDPAPNILGEAFPGFPNRDQDSGNRASGERRRFPISPSELQDLEAVFGDGDPHALEKLVVEVSDVFVLELVVGEGETVLVDEGIFEICSRQP